jgi:hypothetical protein
MNPQDSMDKCYSLATMTKQKYITRLAVVVPRLITTVFMPRQQLQSLLLNKIYELGT